MMNKCLYGGGFLLTCALAVAPSAAADQGTRLLATGGTSSLEGSGGGPCDYSGEDMKTSHRNMGVDNADFNALVEHLIAAMEKENVPVSAQNQLLGVLAPMHSDIVEE